MRELNAIYSTGARRRMFNIVYNQFLFSSVPSRSPSYITFTDVKATRITVHWSPLPQQYHNGRLLGYKVYFQRSAYYSYPSQSNGSSLIVSNPNTTLVTLTGLRPGQRYDISVSAFTSKGEGPPSYRFYVTTGAYVMKQCYQ